MRTEVFLRDDVAVRLTAVLAALEAISPYDRGRQAGVLLAAAALGIAPAHLLQAAQAIRLAGAGRECEESASLPVRAPRIMVCAWPAEPAANADLPALRLHRQGVKS